MSNEPPTVRALRGQMARGATDSLLHRIAGSAAEFNRLAALYGLRDTPEAPAAIPGIANGPKTGDPLPQRQAMLLARLTALAQSEQAFPGAVILAEKLDCSWLVVEKDLRQLAAKKLIRIDTFRDRGQREHKRIAIVGTRLQTALPAKVIVLVAVDRMPTAEGANGVREPAAE